MPSQIIGWAKRCARRCGIGLYRPGEEWRLAEPAQLERFLTRFAVDCVFDVGANCGQYATGLRALGYKSQILSFEPNPDVVGELRSAAAADDRWEVFEIALDSTAREVEFNVMEASEFSSLREPDHSKTEAFVDQNRVRRKVALMTRTLAEIYPKLKSQFGFRRPFLKLDTQGHDLEVVRGADEYVQQFVGLQSELSLTGLYEGAPGYAETLAEYQSRGFRLSGLVPNNSGHFPDLIEVDCIMYNPAFAVTGAERPSQSNIGAAGPTR